MPDTIEIRRLQVSAHIGVPDEERSIAQTLWVTVCMVPSQGFEGLADEVSRTIDYHVVALEIQGLAAAKPRKLIETLARDTADWLLANHPLKSVAVTIEKRILPDAECVLVHLQRDR